MIRDRLNQSTVALREWLYPQEITPGHRVRCQLPGCHVFLGRSGHHLRFRSLRRSDAALPPEWVGWHCSRCGHLNVYCPIDGPGGRL
jgi:hypothetical protein